MSQLDLLRPAPFHSHPNLLAGFTHRNPHIQTSQQIRGLHFNGALDDEKTTVHTHYALVGEAIGFDGKQVAWVNQIHGDKIWYADSSGALGEGDALYTDRPGLILTVRVADCAAVLLADAEAQVVAAVHAGWRGARLNIVSKTIEKMKASGANPSRMVAYVSPCISTTQFEVGEDVAAEFPEKYVVRDGFVKPHVDLKQFLRDELLENGISANNLLIDGRCTVENADDLYSYRREGKISGRMIGFIGVKAEV